LWEIEMIDNNKWTIVTGSECPEAAEKFYEQKSRIWPEFMRRDKVANKLWHPYLNEIFKDFQLYLLNEHEEPIAVGHSMPLTWDGTVDGLPVGWNDCLTRGAADHKVGRSPNTLAAIEISIQPEFRGQGVSYRMIEALRSLAAQHGFQAVIVAVRPSLKTLYPLTPMERYIKWQREDGAPFDPWLRVHWRVGGELLKVAHPSMNVEGTVDEWESWAGMKFPDSGHYVHPEAIVPIEINREGDIGCYIEPNVWVHHPITTERLGGA
jgi:GNAT superfamily N-acetyltransferase